METTGGATTGSVNTQTAKPLIKEDLEGTIKNQQAKTSLKKKKNPFGLKFK